MQPPTVESQTSPALGVPARTDVGDEQQLPSPNATIHGNGSAPPRASKDLASLRSPAATKSRLGD
jgi:hypothetical protein